MVDQTNRVGSLVGPGLSKDGILSKASGERREASEVITAGDPLRILADGKWARCSTSTYEEATAVAVASEDGIIGDDLLAIYIGRVDLPLLLFTGSEALFVKADGTATNIATTIVGEFVTRIGKGLYTGSIFVQCEEPVEVT